MAKRDYYDVLGIEKDASQEQIKKAYRALALKYHPDRNKEKNAESQFKEVAEAYGVLSDSQNRQIYDQYGHAGESRSHGGWHGPDPDEIFSQIFGGGFGFRQQKRRRGSDIHVHVPVTLEEVAKGTKKEIKFERYTRCHKCKGEGGTGESCSTCGGHGQTRHQQGPMQVVSTCRTCDGTGTKITEKCTTCDGEGLVAEYPTVAIEIPPGIASNETIVVEGEGHQEDLGLPRGHLGCIIQVKKHPIFSRRGQHLLSVQKISMVQACLGDKMKIPTIDGSKVEVQIPPGTQPGQILRVKGQGLPTLTRGNMMMGKGDQLLEVKIEIPTNVSPDAAKLLKEFDKKCR